MGEIILYHGSNKIVNAPDIYRGMPYNDFGPGFYMTENEETAGHWACMRGTNGYINKYSFDTEGLNVLDLNSPDYILLHWLSVVVNNRIFRSTDINLLRGLNFLKTRYLPKNIDGADVIKGYRADDSYFSFVRAFLNNRISYSQLKMFMNIGTAGEQIVIKSEEALSRLSFISYTPAEGVVYYPKRKSCADKAKTAFFAEMEAAKYRDEKWYYENGEPVFMNDIVKEEMLEDNESLQ